MANNNIMMNVTLTLPDRAMPSLPIVTAARSVATFPRIKPATWLEANPHVNERRITSSGLERRVATSQSTMHGGLREFDWSLKRALHINQRPLWHLTRCKELVPFTRGT